MSSDSPHANQSPSWHRGLPLFRRFLSLFRPSPPRLSSLHPTPLSHPHRLFPSLRSFNGDANEPRGDFNIEDYYSVDIGIGPPRWIEQSFMSDDSIVSLGVEKPQSVSDNQTELLALSRTTHIHQYDSYSRFAIRDDTTTVFADHREIAVFKKSTNYKSKFLDEHILDIKIQDKTLFVLTLNKILKYSPNDLNLNETVTLSSSDYGRLAVTRNRLYITREYEGIVLKYNLTKKKFSEFVSGFDRPRAVSVEEFSGNVVIAEDREIHVYRHNGAVDSRFSVHRPIFDVESIDGDIYVLVREGVGKYVFDSELIVS